MSLDSATVKRVGRLARLKVPDEKVEPLRADLVRILKFIDQLSEVNTDAVEPMVGSGQRQMPMREDMITDGNYVSDVLANAPESAQNMFVVPKVVE
ncbi:Aspartyl/glutamyl-tRNA amidotransferase subunit C [Candidatus Bealeia paramacronuclearis]|uniref:Aspartyl/glutamyl-tRNA(Asn/Gln) amidotransferase subunit C n=1 Tax=Candidatus Bealeia paramacronuclearis TaxID=1921001 RepID=A0ABZ2C5H1_9PROT|nr:Aspartyl/glutamyl-tRNA amidotransferase subunit C [Candidatus Bealeia paramacronuclearis]